MVMSGENWPAGPWEVDHEEGWVVREARGPDGLRFLVADMSWFDGGDEEKAAAHLIAAGPELYEALMKAEAFIAYHAGALDRTDLLPKVSAALRKARGETN
jgi:hypothetical protein